MGRTVSFRKRTGGKGDKRTYWCEKCNRYTVQTVKAGKLYCTICRRKK